MKKKITLLAATLLAVYLTACYPTEVTPEGDTIKINSNEGIYYDLVDGRRVLCIEAAYGFSCDWDHATVNIGSSEDK